MKEEKRGPPCRHCCWPSRLEMRQVEGLLVISEEPELKRPVQQG